MIRGRGLPTSNEFVICEGCNKSVAVALLSTHNCSKVVVETQTESNKKKKPPPPPTAFYLFMSDFRKDYEKTNPYVNLKDVPKLGGEKWKSFTEDEKKVYWDSAARLMTRYDMSLEISESHEKKERKTRKLMIA